MVVGAGDLLSLIATPEKHDRLVQLENSIANTLNSLREEFHRSASVSTRQEVLDLVAGLVFAHVISIDNGGQGIGPYLTNDGDSAADALNRFIGHTFATHLRGSWRRSFTSLKAQDERFAQELLQIFKNDAAAFRDLHNAGRDDLINEVFSRFMSTSFVDEKEMGQYLTPPEIVRFMVEIGLNAVTEYEHEALATNGAGFGFLLDPSCGVGSFLAEAIRRIFARERANRSVADASSWVSRFVSDHVIGIDKSERMVRLAAINLSLFGAAARKLYVANALARSGADGNIGKALEGQVQLILTNPPFGATFSGSDIAGFEIGKGKRKVESEILFLERYVDWLAPRGVIVSVVPDSVLVNRGAFAELRELLFKLCNVEGVFSLPPVTFAGAGTSTKTSILLMRKRVDGEQRRSTYFGEAREVGFDVITRAGQRRRVRTGRNDLPAILGEFLGKRSMENGRRHILSPEANRWDAAYHIGLPSNVAAALNTTKSFIKVADIASLVDERVDPRRSGQQEFDYIEISDIDIRTGLVGHKRVATRDAPSRARKQTRAGDVLVSTVRPERGSVEMVPSNLHGAICSTGIAILRCFAVEPLALVWLLKTQFIRHQMVLNNIGIAYPAISEQACLGLILPITKEELSSLSTAAKAFEESQIQFENYRRQLMTYTDRLDAKAIAQH